MHSNLKVSSKILYYCDTPPSKKKTNLILDVNVREYVVPCSEKKELLDRKILKVVSEIS